MQISLSCLSARVNQTDSIAVYVQNARRLHSYFPDPTTDIDNKVRCHMSAGAVQKAELAATHSLSF